MLQLLLVGVAAWMAYEAVRAVVPVAPAIQPITVIVACYLLSKAPAEVLFALDASAMAATVRIIVQRLSEGYLERVTPSARPRLWQRQQSRPSRIPDLP